MQGASVWQETSIPIVSAAGWSRDDLHAGFRELERISRETDAAFATLLASFGERDRDSVAAMARATQASTKTARQRVQLGEIVVACLMRLRCWLRVMCRPSMCCVCVR
jgi:hypothetical protein